MNVNGALEVLDRMRLPNGAILQAFPMIIIMYG